MEAKGGIFNGRDQARSVPLGVRQLARGLSGRVLSLFYNNQPLVVDGKVMVIIFQLPTISTFQG